MIPSDWGFSSLASVQQVGLFLEPRFEDCCAESHLCCWLPTFLVQILSFALEAICYFSPRCSFVICWAKQQRQNISGGIIFSLKTLQQCFQQRIVQRVSFPPFLGCKHNLNSFLLTCLSHGFVGLSLHSPKEKMEGQLEGLSNNISFKLHPVKAQPTTFQLLK